MNGNLFADLPIPTADEQFQTLLAKPQLRIERIVSHGHCSPDGFWYDQHQDEWVLVLQGQARIGFADRETINLQVGDYCLIPAHCRHRVEWTPSDSDTIWLAIHFDA